MGEDEKQQSPQKIPKWDITLNDGSKLSDDIPGADIPPLPDHYDNNTAKASEACPLKNEKENNDCTFKNYEVSFEYNVDRGRYKRGPFVIEKDTPDKIIQAVCGFDKKYDVVEIKLNGLVKKKCLCSGKAKHFPKKFFDVSAINPNHIVLHTEDTLKLKIFAEQMERPTGMGGLAWNYKQFLVWDYQPVSIKVPINSCGHKEIVEIQVYRDTNLNGTIQIGTLVKEEVGKLNAETKSLDFTSQYKLIGVSFNGNIGYDNFSIPFAQGLQYLGDKLKTISNVASKVFDVAQKVATNGTPPGLKFAVKFPNFTMGCSNTSGVGAGWKVLGATQKCALGYNIYIAFNPIIGGEFEFKILDAAIAAIPGIGPMIVKLKDKYKDNITVDLSVKFAGNISGSITNTMPEKTLTGELSGGMEITITALASGKIDVWKCTATAGASAEAKSSIKFPLQLKSADKSFTIGFSFSGLTVRVVTYYQIGKKSVTVTQAAGTTGASTTAAMPNQKEVYRGVWIEPIPNLAKGESAIYLYKHTF